MNRQLGHKSVPAVGFGCMGMSEFYGVTDDTQSLDTLAYALDAGYRHFDTADMYGSGHNEALLGKFLRGVGGRRSEILLASKVGLRRSPADKYAIQVDGSARHIAAGCEASLERLGVDHIDLYYLHRRDPNVPLEESIGALARLVEAGKIGGIGLCEVSAETLRQAHAIHPVTAVQSEYSLWSREAEDDVLPACAELGVAFVAFSPMGRGFLTGGISKEFIESAKRDDDIRTILPRFGPDHIDRNLQLVAQLKELAQRLDMQPSQLALSWILSRHAHVHVIPGTKRKTYADENFRARDMALDAATLATLEDMFTRGCASGGRYPQAILKKSEA
jgi:aryl-alcohol dehydrogenase-like predicted oxidoreductase